MALERVGEDFGDEVVNIGDGDVSQNEERQVFSLKLH
jgi:hypothetical protein